MAVQFHVAHSVADILTLRSLAAQAVAESRFASAHFSQDKFERLAARLAEDTTRYGVLIAAHASHPVGFLYCEIGEPLVATGLLLTTVQAVYVTAPVRHTLLGGRVANGLFNGVLRWTAARGGCEVLIHHTFGIGAARAHRFFKRRGFRALGGHYARRIDT